MYYLFPPEFQEGLVVSTKTPPHEALYMMPLTNANIQEGAFGSLLMQSVEYEEFSIHQHIFQVHASLRLNLVVEKHAAILIYVLQGKATYTFPEMEDVSLEEGSYYLLYIPAGKHSIQLETNVYMVVQLELSLLLLNKLAATYYGMYETSSRITENIPDALLLKENWMSPPVCDILGKMIYCRLEDELGAVYQEARMRDLLLLYREVLQDNDKKKFGNFKFSSADIDNILEAGNQQLRTIDDTVYLKDMARDAYLHPKKLHAGFKKVFGKSPAKLITDARMERTKTLLKETDKSVKDIAYEVGFCNASALIRAFKRHEGITPLQYRK